MAQGDRRSVSYGRSGGWGSTYTYNDGGRGRSKSYYEEFEGRFAAASYDAKWLLGISDVHLPDDAVYKYVTNMTMRYNVHDWAWNKYEDPQNNDGRVRRLVEKKCDVAVWRSFQNRAKAIQDKIESERELERKQAQEQWDAEHRASLEARKIRREAEYFQLMNDVQLVAGAMQSQFMEAFESVEIINRREGEWLDDAVSGMTTGYGFGEEVERAKGLKIQVTVSLDLSNSMTYNKLADPAVAAFRNMYMALKQIQTDHPDDMFVAAFEFSKDGWAEGVGTRNEEWRPGRVAKRLEETSSKDPHHIGAMEEYHPGQYHRFYGEDTWFYPLFTEIEKWENEESDAGAVKIDLIITDAVLEHDSDIRLSDKIQERRDGILHTVMLNFLPMSKWADQDLPARCIQYAADPDNMAVALRNILLEYVGVYI